MGKACKWFGGVALTLFIAYASINAAIKDSPWYLEVLYIAFIVAGALFILTGLVYLFLLWKKYRNPLDILDDWRCTYWPSEKQVGVTTWFRDYSNASNFLVKCIAQFGQQVFKFDDVTIGGTYMGKGGLKSGIDQPIMVEFIKHNIEIDDTSTVKLTMSIRPSSGVWSAKRRSNVVSVQVINREDLVQYW